MPNDRAIVPPATVAVIGLGRMGLPMAARLVQAGYAVRGFDPVEAAREALARAGGSPADTGARAAQGAAAVITILPDGAAVRAAVLDGAAPVAAAMEPGGVLIDMSSSAPLSTRALGEALEPSGIGLVDAPVSGGVKKAVAGTLAVMVGGPGPLIARVMPVLRAMAGSVFETGALGSAHAMKALNNYVSAAGLIAACEAVRIGTAFGLDPAVMTDVLNASTGRNNTTENKLKAFILNEAYDSGFGLALMTKDVGIAADLAAALGRPAPFSAAVVDLARRALADLGPDADHTEIDRYLGRLAPP